MKRIQPAGMLLLCASVLAVFGCGQADRAQQGQETQRETAVDARQDVLYVCDCGPECKCGAVSKSAGDCDCGKALRWTHVVMVEGNDALLCTCGEGCSCSLDGADPTKCVCGNPVRRVSLEGTGIYYCNCGGSCRCNVTSDKPGECPCGMALTRS